MKSWNIDSKLVQDPVFSLNLPQKNLKGTVGIQLRNFPTLTDKFLEKLAQNVREKFSDKKIQIISLQDSIDLEVCEKFKQMLKLENSEVLSGLSINDVFEVISNLEYLIGMRFHANVVAIKCGVKTTAINYDIKVKKLAEEYNLPLIELEM